MDKLVISKQELTTPEKIVNFGLAITAHKKKIAEWEKEFRDRAKEWFKENNLKKIETESGTIQQARDSETITYDPDTVERVLGEDWIVKKANNTAINNELRKLRDGFTPEQKIALDKTAFRYKRKGNIIIKPKK